MPSSSSSKQLRPSRGTCPGPRTAASRATCPSQPKKRKKINGKKKDPEMLKIKYYGCSLVRVNSQRAAGSRKSILCTQSPQGSTPFHIPQRFYAFLCRVPCDKKKVYEWKSDAGQWPWANRTSPIQVDSTQSCKIFKGHPWSPHPYSLLNSTLRHLPWHIQRLLLPIS